MSVFRISSEHGQALKDIEKKINEIMNMVTQKPSGDKPAYSGNPGGLQVVEKENGEVVLQVKTDKGWHETSALNPKEN